MAAFRMKSVRILAFVTLGTLAGCGVDGDPVPPPSLNAGLGVPNDGNVRGGVGIDRGPVSLYFGF
jgi:hypothetical protein